MSIETPKSTDADLSLLAEVIRNMEYIGNPPGGGPASHALNNIQKRMMAMETALRFYADPAMNNKATTAAPKPTESDIDTISETIGHLYGDGYNCLYLNARSALVRISDWLAAVPTWIAVKEQMPPIGQTVLLCINGNLVFKGYLNTSSKFATDHGPFPDHEQGRISHWMPMPLPPSAD